MNRCVLAFAFLVGASQSAMAAQFNCFVKNRTLLGPEAVSWNTQTGEATVKTHSGEVHKGRLVLFLSEEESSRMFASYHLRFRFKDTMTEADMLEMKVSKTITGPYQIMAADFIKRDGDYLLWTFLGFSEAKCVTM